MLAPKLLAAKAKAVQTVGAAASLRSQRLGQSPSHRALTLPAALRELLPPRASGTLRRSLHAGPLRTFSLLSLGIPQDLTDLRRKTQRFLGSWFSTLHSAFVFLRILEEKSPPFLLNYFRHSRFKKQYSFILLLIGFCFFFSNSTHSFPLKGMHFGWTEMQE